MGKHFPVVGQGHQGNSNLPVIRQPELTPQQKLVLRSLQPGSLMFKMGRVSIIVSPPVIEKGMGWHISISHPDRYPTWDEVAAAWYQLVPDADNRVGAMILPKREDYISVHNYCFQVHEQIDTA